MAAPVTFEDRLFRFVTKQEDGCWDFNGSLRAGPTNRDYGRIRSYFRFTYYAHRVSFEWFRGPISVGLTLDHLCKNVRCVNPWHLEPVTREENNRRQQVRRLDDRDCLRVTLWCTARANELFNEE